MINFYSIRLSALIREHRECIVIIYQNWSAIWWLIFLPGDEEEAATQARRHLQDAGYDVHCTVSPSSCPIQLGNRHSACPCSAPSSPPRNRDCLGSTKTWGPDAAAWWTSRISSRFLACLQGYILGSYQTLSGEKSLYTLAGAEWHLSLTTSIFGAPKHCKSIRLW